MVGVHVVLDIVPQRIDPAAWADAFEATRALLEAHPARLLGYGFRIVGGVRVPVFTRGVAQGEPDSADRRWCVVGDRATLGTGERQRMYRDLSRYVTRVPPLSRPGEVSPITLEQARERAASADIVTSWAEGGPPPEMVRVFGEGDQSEPCRLPLLAAAMVVETRFPRCALASGRFDREQAEAARRWAKGILGQALALPVRVDAWRLIERLGVRLEGAALVRAVDRLYLAEPGVREATLLGVFGRAEAAPWFAGKLREHATAADPGALRLMAAYLDATRDLARLAGLACVDPRGPRWPAEAFVAALATLLHDAGASGRPLAYDGGSASRVAGPRLDGAAIEHTLGLVFGESAPRLCAAFRAATAMPMSWREPATEPPPTLIDALARLDSPGELSLTQRAQIHALATAARDGRPRCDAHGGPPSVSDARRAVASALARGGPTLTEDAWDWLEREDDPELCAFLAALTALAPVSAEHESLRRVLLENRALCRYAATMSTSATEGATERGRDVVTVTNPWSP